MTTLQHLFRDELASMYYAEIQINLALPRIAKSATLPDLRDGLDPRLGGSHERLPRIEEIFRFLGEHPKARQTEAITGLLKTGRETIASHDDPETVDAAVVLAMRRILHFQTAGYVCLRNWSLTLGNAIVSAHLQAILEELGSAEEALEELDRRLWHEPAGSAAKDSDSDEDWQRISAWLTGVATLGDAPHPPRLYSEESESAERLPVSVNGATPPGEPGRSEHIGAR